MFYLKQLVAYRELLWNWTMRNVKGRYKQSVLGIAWAICQPFFTMVVFSVVFSVFFKVPSEGVPYPVFSYTALVPWMFFATSLSSAIPSIGIDIYMVTKSYFPREILPISAVLARFVDYVIALSLLIAMMIFYRVPLNWTIVTFPLIVLIQFLLILGISLLGATVNVFFRDVSLALPLILRLWMYATPIIYPASSVPEKFRLIYYLNPMVGIIDSYRRVLLHGQLPDWTSLCITTIISVVLCVVGYIYFKNREHHFADVM